jgi:hypothetical protein
LFGQNVVPFVVEDIEDTVAADTVAVDTVAVDKPSEVRVLVPVDTVDLLEQQSIDQEEEEDMRLVVVQLFHYKVVADSA